MNITDRKALAEKYFSSLSEPIDTKRVETIASAIKANGFWEESFEWRISTERTARIEPFEYKGKTWYRVALKNGLEASVVCPTITRSVHYLSLLESMSADLFYTHGWSSWADKSRMQAEPNEV